MTASLSRGRWVNTFNTLRPRQNGRHFADDMFKCIFLTENVWISIEISLKFVPKGSINNIPALFQIMAWRRPGAKPLSEPMMVSSLTHICVTRPQWVNSTLQSCVKWTHFYRHIWKDFKHFIWWKREQKCETLPRGHFYWHWWSIIPAWIINYKCGMKLFIYSRTSTVLPLKFGNG